MKSYLKICFSILKKNKAFSAGLFIMALLSVAIAFLGANLGKNSEDNLIRYLDNSGIPDAIITTSVIVGDNSDKLDNIPGVSIVSPRFVFDTTMKTQTQDELSVRIHSWDENSTFNQTLFETAQTDGTVPGVFISVGFARHNGIHAGDQIVLITPLGEKSAVVEATVSNPEAMNCQKDVMSNYESYQFGYIYIRTEDFDKLTFLPTIANQWLVYFDANASSDQQEAAMDQIRAFLGNNFISEFRSDKFEDNSDRFGDINSIKTLSTVIPIVIWLLSLGFSFIFIRIIIENQRKTIGLLRALGFSTKKVVALFIGYTAMINLPAVMIGIPCGNFLLNICVKRIMSASNIVDCYISISSIKTIVVVSAVFLIGIIASLLGARTIAQIDPSRAYGGKVSDYSEPANFITHLKTDAFVKISLASMIRSRKRQIIGMLCVSACAVCICIGLEGSKTIGYPTKVIYGKRYTYDIMIRSIDDSDAQKISSSVSGIKRIEPVTHFTSEMFGDEVRVSTIAEDAEMITLTDSRDNRLLPGDGVIIDEMRAKYNNVSVGDTVMLGQTPLTVTGIAREILATKIYISPETAASMGHSETNCLMIRYSDGITAKEIKEQVSDIDPGAYFTELAGQKAQITNGFVAMRTVMIIFALLATAIGTLLVFNMAIIDFNEKASRYATLRALGVPKARLGLISVVENTIRTVAGVIIACPLCYICSIVIVKLLSTQSHQYVLADFPICLLVSCTIPIVYVIIGVLISLWKIAKMDFNQYLNQVE